MAPLSKPFKRWVCTQCMATACGGRDDLANWCHGDDFRPCPGIGFQRTGSKAVWDKSWEYARQLIWLRDHGQCVFCHQPAAEVDHIMPRKLGGTDHPRNLRLICNQCHDGRHTARSEGITQYYYERKKTKAQATAFWNSLLAKHPPTEDH